MTTGNPLSLLVGKTVEVHWDGLRTAVVKKAVNAHTLTCQFLGNIGRHRVDTRLVRGVFYRRKLYTVNEYLDKHTKGTP